MKIINTNCTNCGAPLEVYENTKYIKCKFCGNTFLYDDGVQHIKYDNAEEAGYLFEKGRQRAKNEFKQDNQPSRIQIPVDQKQSSVTQNKVSNKKIWLWVLGWIIIFPLPLTIIMLRNKKMNKAVKYGIIALAWIIYIAIGLSGSVNSSDKSGSTSGSISSSSSTGNTAAYDSSKPLVGKFEAAGFSGLFYTFNEDGTGEYELLGEVIKLNYSIKDGKLVIEFHSDEMGTMTVDYKIDETKLSMKDITGSYVDYIRK